MDGNHSKNKYASVFFLQKNVILFVFTIVRVIYIKPKYFRYIPVGITCVLNTTEHI